MRAQRGRPLSVSVSHSDAAAKTPRKGSGVSNKAILIEREKHHALESFAPSDLHFLQPGRGRIAHAHQMAALRSWEAQRGAKVNGVLALIQIATECVTEAFGFENRQCGRRPRG